MKLPVFLIILLMPLSAQASYWKDCDVTAIVTETGTAGTYQIMVKEAVVTDGHATEGEPCFQTVPEKPFVAPIEGVVPTGEKIRLKYSYYDDAGPDGVIVSETWTYDPKKKWGWR